MPAKILPFPKPRSELLRPEALTQEVHHLDLAALKLLDRGWEARAGVYSAQRNRTAVPGLSTNAPDFEVTAALVNAFDDLCGFLLEMFEYSAEELPDRADFQPNETQAVCSEFQDGRVFGYP
jgi:hypothetical protein